MKKLTLSVLQLILLSGIAQLALAKDDFCQEAAEIIKTTINTQTMEVTPYSNGTKLKNNMFMQPRFFDTDDGLSAFEGKLLAYA